ncbi:hypothetical protein CC80DRAFT_374802, partial [Byssothecium circinans]
IVRDRLDPTMTPGGVSSHVHTIVSGSDFALNFTYDDALGSGCTYCPLSQVKSS